MRIQEEQHSRHPARDLLESYAAGDATPDTAIHTSECVQCAAYVAELRAALHAFRATAEPTRIVHEVLARATAQVPKIANGAPLVGATSERRRRLLRLLPRALPGLAVAAVAVLWLRRAPAPASVGTEPFASAVSVSMYSASTEGVGVRSKGSAPVAIVLERQGNQTRIVGPLQVRAGDRLRVEITQEQAALCMALLLMDDGSEVLLQPPAWLTAGVHFSERAARFDANQRSGTVLVGEPARVRLAVKNRRMEGIDAIRVQYE
jgi:hypothetical protein